MIQKIFQKFRDLKKQGFFHILVGGTLSKMMAFISSIVIVRLVDKPAYSDLAYADNLYSYIILIVGLGMSSGILKYCTNKDERMNRFYFRFAFKWGIISAVGITAIFLLGIYFIDIPFPGSKKIIYVLGFYPLLYYISTLFQSYLRTNFQNKLFAFSNLIQALFTFIGSILFLMSIGITGIPYARMLAAVIAIICCTPFIYRNTIGFDDKSVTAEIKPFLVMSISLLIANLMSMIMPLNESFLINNLIQSEEITANYKVANLIPSNLPFITSAIITFYFPIIAREEDRNKVWKLTKKVGLYTMAVVFGIAVIGCLCTPMIIKIVYGAKYNNITWLSTALWGIYAMNAGIRMIPMNILPAIGITKFNVQIAAISSVIHFIIDYIMIKLFGIYGAVYASGFIYVSSGFVYWIYLYRQCKKTTF